MDDFGKYIIGVCLDLMQVPCLSQTERAKGEKVTRNLGDGYGYGYSCGSSGRSGSSGGAGGGLPFAHHRRPL